jgi:hypothetical protein
MGILPEQPLKAKQLRERYRLQRRRQALMLASCAGLGVVFVALVLATALLVRGCSRPAEDGPLITKIQRHQPTASAGRIEVAGINSFRTAPWLMAVDDQRLYIASDSHKQALAELNYPIDSVAAYQAGETTPQWELDLPPDSQAGGLVAAGGNVCLYTYHLVDPPYIELRGLAGNDGANSWYERIDQAEQAQVVTAGGVVVVNYFTTEGYRLIGYRGADGQRSSLGLKVPLKGLAANATDQALSLEFKLYAWGNFIGYSHYNVAGVVDVAKGKLVYENALDFYVFDLAYDEKAKRAYVLTGGETGDSYVIWELAKDGIPLELYSFLCATDDILLLVEGGYIAVAYQVAEGAAEGCTKLVLLKRETGAVQVEHVFDQPGVAADLVSLPDAGEASQFLLALNGGEDKDDWPIGKAQLYLVEPKAQEPVQFLAQLNQPVQYLWTLGQDCLLACRGGQVFSYDANELELAKTIKLKYELALPLVSASGRTLALASAPRDRWQGKPGQSTAIAVLRQAQPAEVQAKPKK